jgi:hypothetical protein
MKSIHSENLQQGRKQGCKSHSDTGIAFLQRFLLANSLVNPAYILFLLVCAGCAQLESPPKSTLKIVYTVQAGERAIARVITMAAMCPRLVVDGVATELPMTVRAPPRQLPARAGSQDAKPVVFDVLTCEAELPAELVSGAAEVRVEGRNVPLPRRDVKTIVILGDTGCRMKQSDKFFQDCKNPDTWPLEQIAERAAALKPDLVIHVGDYHYRESPCPADVQGCAGSPWGYGYDTWDADFFRPARALLLTAPWVFVRGNHESCFRAGQGWFRFLAPEPWTVDRSCDDSERDADADYSPPYAVPLRWHGTAHTQLIVFDSSRAASKAYEANSPAYKKYFAELQAVDRLASTVPHSLFLSHHPVLAFAPERADNATMFRPGNAGLQSVMRTLHPERLFAPGIDLAMHGHVHLFESVSFSDGRPAALVLGNSGSYRDVPLPALLPPGTEPAPGAAVREFATRSNFGFASLQRAGANWQLTEWDVHGRATLRCSLHGTASHCVTAGAEP